MKTKFFFKYHQKWSMSDIDDLIPWQFAVYKSLTRTEMEKENEERKRLNQQRRR